MRSWRNVHRSGKSSRSTTETGVVIVTRSGANPSAVTTTYWSDDSTSSVLRPGAAEPAFRHRRVVLGSPQPCGGSRSDICFGPLGVVQRTDRRSCVAVVHIPKWADRVGSVVVGRPHHRAQSFVDTTALVTNQPPLTLDLNAAQARRSYRCRLQAWRAPGEWT